MEKHTGPEDENLRAHLHIQICSGVILLSIKTELSQIHRQVSLRSLTTL